MERGIHITSEIGNLRTALVHMPGAETVNYDYIDLERVFGSDSFDLERAQAEHRDFCNLLCSAGVEVLELEMLAAEAIAESPHVRKAFIDRFLMETNLKGRELLEALGASLEGTQDPLDLVRLTMRGMHFGDVLIPSERNGLTALTHSGTEPNALLADPMTDLFFTRDPVSLFEGTMRLNRMYWRQRNRETLFYRTIFTNHPRFAGTSVSDGQASTYFAEGGDSMMLSPTTALIGFGKRTHPAAIDAMASELLWGTAGVGASADACRPAAPTLDELYALSFSPVGAPEHLDGYLSQIDRDAFACSQQLLHRAEGYLLTRGAIAGEVRVQRIDGGLSAVLTRAADIDSVRLVTPLTDALDGYTANDRAGSASLLCLRPGVVCSFESDHAMNEALDKAGYEVKTFQSIELTKSFGGPHCLALPLKRDER